ncbi:MAG: DUF72 domain-containing protein [Spirochaetaceae bacterium]|nr:MAG: DUF72 domain-containing protein [Spirochaetaceae bacterium]
MVRIGTSGWTYKHWKGNFYPENLPQRRWLEYYTEHFNTVELNASFYHIPKASTARGWAERTPANFRFSVKASRLITHVHKLKSCEDTVEWFFRELEPLREKISAFLFQLPPSFSPPPEDLESFIALLPRDNRYVFELRNPCCYSGPIPELLQRFEVAFCIHDLSGRETPPLANSSLVYIRFHGSGGRYAGSYSDAELEQWATRIRSWNAEGRHVLAYFNNDIEGHAIANARTLATKLDH